MAAPNRYSTLIAWTKIVLPLAAIALLSTLFLFASRPNPEDALLISDRDIGDLAREQVLNEPRFAGTLEDGREILFTAERAAPVPETTDQFEAEGISARLVLAPGLEALLDAERADVDMTASRATLAGGVEVTRTDGMRLATDILTLGLSRMAALAPGPVSITGPGLSLDAGAMELTEENGPQILSFTGGVRVVYDPATEDRP